MIVVLRSKMARNNQAIHKLPQTALVLSDSDTFPSCHHLDCRRGRLANLHPDVSWMDAGIEGGRDL